MKTAYENNDNNQKGSDCKSDSQFTADKLAGPSTCNPGNDPLQSPEITNAINSAIDSALRDIRLGNPILSDSSEDVPFDDGVTLRKYADAKVKMDEEALERDRNLKIFRALDDAVATAPTVQEFREAEALRRFNERPEQVKFRKLLEAAEAERSEYLMKPPSPVYLYDDMHRICKSAPTSYTTSEINPVVFPSKRKVVDVLPERKYFKTEPFPLPDNSWVKNYNDFSSTDSETTASSKRTKMSDSVKESLDLHAGVATLQPGEGDFGFYGCTRKPSIIKGVNPRHPAAMLRDRVRGRHSIPKVPTTEQKYINILKSSVGKYSKEIGRLEDLAGFIYSLTKCDSFFHMTVEAMKYIKTLYRDQGTICGHMISLAEHVMQSDQKDILESHAGVLETDVISKFRQFIDGWKANQEGPFAKYMCNIVSLLAFAQLFPTLPEFEEDSENIVNKGATGVSPDGGAYLAGFKLFSTKVLSRQMSCSELFMMLAETALFFLERGKLAFKSGNASAILYTDTELIELDLEYSVLVSCVPLIESGKLSQFTLLEIPGIKDETDYELRLDKLLGKIISASNSKEMSAPGKAALLRKITDLTRVKVSLVSAQQARPQRMKPFSVEIYGISSVGKTTINSALIRQICLVNGFPDGPGTRVTVNENDQYESEVTASTIAITIDDFGNTKPEFIKESPVKKIIDYVNNAVRNAVKADLNSKGNVPVQPKIFTITTNKKNLNAHVYSVEPASILRRFDYVLTASLKATHKSKAGGFCSEAFKISKDAWNIKIQKVRVVAPQPPSTVSTHEYYDIGSTWNFADALKFLGEASKEHYEVQTQMLIDLENDMSEPLCPHGVVGYVCQECHAVKNTVQAIDEKLMTPEDLAKFDGRITPRKAPRWRDKGARDILKDRLSELRKRDGVSAKGKPPDGYAADDSAVSDPESDDEDDLEIPDMSENEALLPIAELMKRGYGAKWSPPEEGTTDFMGAYIPEDQPPETLDSHAGTLNDFDDTGDSPIADDDFYDTMVSAVPAHMRVGSPPPPMSNYARFKSYVKQRKAPFKVRDRFKSAYHRASNASPSAKDFFKDLGTWWIFCTCAFVRCYRRHLLPCWRLACGDTPNRGLKAVDFFLPHPGGAALRSAAWYHCKGKCYETYTRTRTSVIATLHDIFNAFYSSNIGVAAGLLVAAILVGLKMWHNQRNMQLERRRKETKSDREAYNAFIKCSIDSSKDSYRKDRVLLSFEEFLALRSDYMEHVGDLTVTTEVEEPDCFEPHKGITPLDYDKKEDVWRRPDRCPRVRLSKNGATADQLIRKLRSSMHKIEVLDSRLWSNAFPLKGNYWLVPSHLFPDKDKSYKIRLRRSPQEVLDKNVSAIVDSTSWSMVEGSDFLVLQIPSGGDVYSFIDFIPEVPEKVENVRRGTMVIKQSNCEMTAKHISLNEWKDSINPTPKEGAPPVSFSGYTYYADSPFANGFCMSPVVTSTKCPTIMCFHLAGVSQHSAAGKMDTNKGAGGFSPRSAIEQAISKLDGRMDILSSADFPEKAMTMHYGIDAETHPRNAVNFQRFVDGTEPSLLVIGAHDGPRMSPKSNVHVSPISDSVTKHLKTPPVHKIPDFKCSSESRHAAVEAIAHPSRNAEPAILKRATDDLIEFHRSVYSPADLEQVFPLTFDEAVSGIDGVRGIDRMPLNTSMGFPLNCAKRKYAVVGRRQADGITEIVEYPPMIHDHLKHFVETYRKDERAYHICRVLLKDEARPLEKDTVRAMSAGQFAFNVLYRMLFLPKTRMDHIKWEELEGTVGINAYGPEWTALSQQLDKFDSGLFGAGDYSKFDKRAPPDFVRAAFAVQIAICEDSGNYTPLQLQCMRGIATDVSFPVYENDGVFFQAYGSMPSGIPGTTDLNVDQNSLFIRYAFFKIYGADTKIKFRDVCCLKVYGDDNCMSFADGYPEFNHTSIQEALAEIGVKYTMADKHSSSTAYVSKDQLSFLKRGFRYEIELGLVMGPLEEDSIFKSLHFYTSTGSDTLPETIASDSIEGALQEWFLWGREVYEIRRDQLQNVVDECDFIHLGNLPSFDVLKERYIRKYIDINDAGEDGDDGDGDFYFQGGDMDTGYCIEHDWGQEPGDLEWVEELVLHGAGEEEDESPVTDEQGQLTSFDAHSPGWEVDPSRLDDTRLTMHEIGPHADFFNREVRIYTATWEPEVAFFHRFFPWQIYLSNPRVVNRLNHFRLASGVLHLRFVLNGSPFSQGCVMCSYMPFDDTNNISIVSSGAGSVWRVQESQREHIMLDPTNSTGGDLVLPLNIQEDAMLLTAPDEGGYITMADINRLRHVNGSTSSIFVSVFARMDNFEIDVPTGSDAWNLVPQSGEDDEYGTGAISRPATAISKIAGAMSNLPVIAPYAQAAQVGANLVSKVAGVLGFSRPSIIASETICKVRNVGNMASLYSEDTAVKLSTDPKQGVSVSSVVAGVDKDGDMDIVPLCCKESYLTTFSFGSAQSASDLLFTIPISPVHAVVDALDVVYGVPSMVAALNFDYWRGTMVVRFVVIASNYQRGRLRVVWEPDTAAGINEPPYNVVQSKVIDIAEDTEVNFEIGWGSPLGFLEVPNIPVDSTFTTSNVNVFSGVPGFHNGSLRVYVMSNLIQPGIADVPAEINVFVRCKEDIQFASPSTTRTHELTYFALESQAGVEGEDIKNPAAPTKAGVTHQFSPSKPNPHLLTIYHGESISSFRALFKRYSHIRSLALRSESAGNNDVGFYRFTFPTLFAHRGPSSNSIDTDAADEPFNFVSMTFIHFLAPCYLGYRGGMRYKVIPHGDFSSQGSIGTLPWSLQRRAGDDFGIVGQYSPPPDGRSPVARYGLRAHYGSATGIETQLVNNVGVVEAEVPYQENVRFHYARDIDFNLLSGVPQVSLLLAANGNNAKVKMAHIFMAAADDFTLLYFVGVPAIRKVATPN